jgi:hypothetical protein
MGKAKGSPHIPGEISSLVRIAYFPKEYHMGFDGCDGAGKTKVLTFAGPPGFFGGPANVFFVPGIF